MSGLTTLGLLAGPNLQNTNGVAARLGLRSVRIVARLFQKWNSLLSREEKRNGGEVLWRNGDSR